jgi:hypothetical protein
METNSAARKIKNDLMDAIRSLYQIPERFPFLEAEFIPPNKYHKMFVEKRYMLTTSWITGHDYGWLVC